MSLSVQLLAADIDPLKETVAIVTIEGRSLHYHKVLKKQEHQKNTNTLKPRDRLCPAEDNCLVKS